MKNNARMDQIMKNFQKSMLIISNGIAFGVLQIFFSLLRVPQSE